MWRPGVGLLLLGLWGVSSVGAALEPVWQSEAEKAVPGQLAHGVAVAADPAASGAQAVRIPYDAQFRGTSVAFGTPKLKLAGPCRVTFYLRGEGMLPMSNGLVLGLIVHDAKTGGWAHVTFPRIYGMNLKPQGYTPVTLTLDTSFPAAEYPLEFLFTWEQQPQGVSPALWVDKVEVSRPQAETAYLAEVFPVKARYAPGEEARVRVVVCNPGGAEAALTIEGEERRGLDLKREAFKQDLKLPAGESREVTGTWKLTAEEGGREIAVRLLQGGREIGASCEVFPVTAHPLGAAIGNGYDRGYEVRDLHTIFYVAPAAEAESERSVRDFRRRYTVGFEFFSWSPGDISDLSPTEDPFPGGEGRIAYRSVETIQAQNGLLRAAGIWPVSYVNGTCWAMSGYALFQQHPEWFLYDGNGEVAHYEMDSREKYRDRNDLEFNPDSYPGIFFQATLNHALPEVQEYVARQYVKCGQQMGFQGVRMDVRYLEVYPGERDFTGKEVAPTSAEADRISAASVKNVKRLVHETLPDFTFGYNYASPEEVTTMMATFKERCEGGGWMLDEIPCSYQEKTSPYHFWDAYTKRMISWGDEVRKYGGIYNPFDFRRGGANFPVDQLYSAVIRLVASGRFSCYYNSRLPMGNLAQLAQRYSELLYGKNLDWIKQVKTEAAVKSAAPLWWKDSCLWNRTAEGKRQLIVHLINPPAKPEVEENPRSELRPVVRNVEVSAAPVDGQLPTAAYLVTAEALEPWGVPQTQALRLDLKTAGGRATVTVPSVIFWKMVVFQY